MKARFIGYQQVLWGDAIPLVNVRVGRDVHTVQYDPELHELENPEDLAAAVPPVSYLELKDKAIHAIE